MYSVIIVDDDETYRRLLRATLEGEEDFSVLAEAGDVSEALELINHVHPDLIIMDVQLPSMNGFDGTRLILGHHPSVRVVLVSRTGRQQEYSLMAQEAGAVAFITKSALSVSALRQALQA